MYSPNIEHCKVMPKRVSVEQPQYKLSKEQRKFYEDNGYLVIKNLIAFEDLYSYKKRFLQISNGIVPSGNMTVQKNRKLMEMGAKPEDYVIKIQDILYDDVLSHYIEHPALLDIVSQFIGDDISAIHSMLINKPPGTGRHPSHQDILYFALRPIEKLVGAWTAIDEVTIENGCLYVVPGSHRLQPLQHGDADPTDENLRLYHGIMDPVLESQSVKVDLEISPGDTVFLHPLLMHGSRPNVSKNYRKIISCHYANSNCYMVDPEGTVHEGVAREIQEVFERKGFHYLTLKDYYRARSKTVRGVKSLL